MAPRKLKSRRTWQDLMSRLRAHLSLLREYRDRAPTDDRFYGEIAAKLRILVCPFRSNVPLLTNLMAACNFEATILHNGRHVLLEDYLNEYAVESLKPIPTAGGAQTFERGGISNLTFVRAWAEQAGAAHEDWDIEHWLDDLFELRQCKITDGHSGTLLRIADDVLKLASYFLDKHPEGPPPYPASWDEPRPEWVRS